MLRDKFTEYLRSFFEFIGIDQRTGFIIFAVLIILICLFRLRNWQVMEDGDKGLTIGFIMLTLLLTRLGVNIKQLMHA